MIAGAPVGLTHLSIILSYFLAIGASITCIFSSIIPLTKAMFIQGMREFQYCMNLVAYNVATKYKDFGIWI